MFDHRAARVWSQPDRFATTLTVLCVDRYGIESMNWLPEVWRAEIQSDTGVLLPDSNLDRLAAASVILTAPDRFRGNAADFEFLCRVLTTGLTRERLDLHELATLYECAWGVTEAAILTGLTASEPGQPLYGDAITTYVRVALDEAGLDDPGVFAAAGLPIGPPRPPEPTPADVVEKEIALQRAHQRTEVVQQLVEAIREGLARLADQVEALPLWNGPERAARWANGIRNSLHRHDIRPSDSPLS